MKTLVKILSTAFFIGYIPFAPGSFGSVFGIILYIFVFQHAGQLYPPLILIFSILGIFISDYAEKKIFKMKDPKEIVIDEVIGILVSFCGVSIKADEYYFIRLIVVFLFFRLFDILKPFPIKDVQKLPGGTGIVIDDIIAGIYASIISAIIFRFF
ncbi:MAG: phosphatidylglycerophosphatase A family protein [Brevinematia bacterium]